MLVAVGADAIGGDEGDQQVVIELGGVVGGEAAGAHVPGQRHGIGVASRGAGVVIGLLGVDAPVSAGVVVRGERQAVVVAELGGGSASPNGSAGSLPKPMPRPRGTKRASRLGAANTSTATASP